MSFNCILGINVYLAEYDMAWTLRFLTVYIRAETGGKFHALYHTKIHIHVGSVLRKLSELPSGIFIKLFL